MKGFKKLDEISLGECEILLKKERDPHKIDAIKQRIERLEHQAISAFSSLTPVLSGSRGAALKQLRISEIANSDLADGHQPKYCSKHKGCGDKAYRYHSYKSLKDLQCLGVNRQPSVENKRRGNAY